MDILGLIALARSKGSGSGGTTNYNQLTNKPQINSHTLTGNQTAAQLGLATPSDIPTVPIQSVNNKTGDVVLTASDVGAKPASYEAPVSSVAGKTGEVTLDGGDVGFSGSATYQSDTVGAKLKSLDSNKQDAPETAGTAGQVLGLDSNLNPVWVDQTGGGGMNIVSLTGTQITQVGADNTFYVCGELTELTFTAPAVGITMIRFTSGITPTVLTINGVTSWMFDNDPTTASLEANKTYDINVLNGVGVVGWA